MSNFKEGDKGSSLCYNDGRVSTTYERRDVPFQDGQGIVSDILVATCDQCREVIGIPAQSTLEIAIARQQVETSKTK